MSTFCGCFGAAVAFGFSCIGGGVRVEVDGRDTAGARDEVDHARRLGRSDRDAGGYTYLSLGLACGLGGLSAVVARGLDRDAGFRANAQQPKPNQNSIRKTLILVFLALYGLCFRHHLLL
ncbi:hypothetical protein OPV22_008760 [Ensete ventricosum]|uniref:Uncharacterized protein n=1 Tax=Ensete ventricosum TaxID=4639 RepID=A0AAV8RHB3_ENSVE|nr:hypothetical protein OPV22_008760 [Ensete ventricosum]